MMGLKIIYERIKALILGNSNIKQKPYPKTIRIETEDDSDEFIEIIFPDGEYDSIEQDTKKDLGVTLKTAQLDDGTIIKYKKRNKE